MTVQGVNPSYFAGMPTVALDPNAHKQNPQYAQMLSQAMQNRSAQAARRRESDEDNAFKARAQDQQGRRDRMANDISKRNAAVNEAGEARLKSGQDFNQDRLKSADAQQLIDGLRKAKKANDKMAVEFFTDELQRRGYKGRNKQESPETFNQRDPSIRPPEPPGPPPPPDRSVYGDSRDQFDRDMAGAPPTPSAAPPDRSPLPPRQPPPTASFPDVGEASPAPAMRAAPPPGPPPAPPAAAAPGRPMASDSAQFYEDMNWHPPTEKELLDRAIADVVAREKAGTPPTAKPLLPGKTLRRRAAESDFNLSADDPLLKAQ